MHKLSEEIQNTFLLLATQASGTKLSVDISPYHNVEKYAS